MEKKKGMSLNPERPQQTVTANSASIYTEAVIDHAMNPRNSGAIRNADGFARVTGSCGDTMEIWIVVRSGIIARSTFITDGCAPSIASGSAVTELARGMTIDGARRISQQDVLNKLGGLPRGSEHCALLASDTLRAAIREYLVMLREPWKKDYRST